MKRTESPPPSAPPVDRLLSPPDIARILGVSRRYAYTLVRSMRHEVYGRCIRVRESDLNAWRAAHVIEPTSSPAATALRLIGPVRARARATKLSEAAGDDQAVPFTMPRTKPRKAAAR